MKKHLLISFIAFNLLLSQAHAFTPEELAQAKKSLLEPYKLKINAPYFSDIEIETEAQRLHNIAMQKLHEQEMRDLEAQKEIAINYLYLRTNCSKEDAIAKVKSEGFDVIDFNIKCEAERIKQLEEFKAIQAEYARCEAERVAAEARSEAECAAAKARYEAERAAEEAELAAREARWEEERVAEQARLEAESVAAEARWKAESEAKKARCEAVRVVEEVRTQKIDALTAGGIYLVDACGYVSENPDLDVDAFLKQYNEEMAARQRIEKLWQTLSGYGFGSQFVDVILQDSDFNLSDLSDLGNEKIDVINHLMHQDYSYKQAIDFVKASNFDAEAFFRAEDEKRDAESAAYEAEVIRQAIETMRNKGLSEEEVNAVLESEDFDAYQFNIQERDRLDDELRTKENARQEVLRAKIEEAYLQIKLTFSDENRARNIAIDRVVAQFGSEEDRLRLFDYKKSQIPVDFNWQTYFSSYPDLAGIRDSIGSEEAKEKWAITHYFLNGQYENRTKYKK